LPEFAGPIRAGRLPVSLVNVFTDAIRQYNAQIRSFAAGHPRVALIDLDLATRAANIVNTEYALVGGRKLNRSDPGKDLDCFFLADVRHPGTLGQGLMAQMFIEVVNAKFAAGIAPIEPREVLALAHAVAPSRNPGLTLANFGGPGRGSSPVGSPARTSIGDHLKAPSSAATR
jgi:hypothetical protein